MNEHRNNDKVKDLFELCIGGSVFLHVHAGICCSVRRFLGVGSLDAICVASLDHIVYCI